MPAPTSRSSTIRRSARSGLQISAAAAQRCGRTRRELQNAAGLGCVRRRVARVQRVKAGAACRVSAMKHLCAHRRALPADRRPRPRSPSSHRSDQRWCSARPVASSRAMPMRLSTCAGQCRRLRQIRVGRCTVSANGDDQRTSWALVGLAYQQDRPHGRAHSCRWAKWSAPGCELRSPRHRPRRSGRARGRTAAAPWCVPRAKTEKMS